ncbi:hypothetical protein pb186bvf_003706 [Paramecium bursaria]
MKYILILVVFALVIDASNLRESEKHPQTDIQGVPCLPKSNLSGQADTHAQTARKSLERFSDDMNEQLRKNSGRQPFPNLYATPDGNCVGNGAEPTPRERKQRRGGA